MINIPTELLRTLVSVVDLGSFTKAAHSLGVTQPAISAQIKRLHALLGIELFDRNVAGISLTPAGLTVVAYARRLLSINDQILQAVEPPPATSTLRLGFTGDYLSPYLPTALVEFRNHWAYRKFSVQFGSNERLLHDLRSGELDLAVAVTRENAEADARHYWTEKMVWARSSTFVVDRSQPVPLVTRGTYWLNYQLAVSALEREGRTYEIAFTAPTILGLTSAVRAGLGVMAVPQRRVRNANLEVCDSTELPELANVVVAVYASDAREAEAHRAFADIIAGMLRRPDQLGAQLNRTDQAEHVQKSQFQST
jgi:DNA-binding transcriptional LysR family regulator